MWGQTDTVIDSFNVNQVSRGDKSESVRTLQSALLEIGRGLNIKNSGGADGEFGRETQKDVLDFQKLMGLSADGVVGKNTWGALSKAQNTQRENAFPPQNLVSYSVVVPTRTPTKPPVNTSQLAIAAPNKKPLPPWVIPVAGLAVVGIVVTLLLSRRKGKRK